MTCISGIEDIRDIEGLEKYREQFEIKKQILPLSE